MYYDQFTEWIPGCDFVEDELKEHEKAEHLDPYKNGNFVLCRDFGLMQSRIKLVDSIIDKLLKI